MAERGVKLPRDAWQQRTACAPARAGSPPAEGDLLFFGTPRGRIAHVGIALGGGYFADCRGVVRIASLSVGNPLYDNALAKQYRGFRSPPRPSV